MRDGFDGDETSSAQIYHRAISLDVGALSRVSRFQGGNFVPDPVATLCRRLKRPYKLSQLEHSASSSTIACTLPRHGMAISERVPLRNLIRDEITSVLGDIELDWFSHSLRYIQF